MSLMVSCRVHDRASAEAEADEGSIVVLFENDVHCNVDGYELLAGLRDAVADTAYVQLVSSGDYIQGGTLGALSHGQYIIDVMHGMGYDAVALGNHEFDYGTPHLKELMTKLAAPVTCANFIDLGTHSEVFSPYVMRSVGKRKIAYIGVLVPTTVESEAVGFFDSDGRQIYDLVSDEICERVQHAADDARREGADYVIVLSHLGQVEAKGISSHLLASRTTGIDAILDGHTHAVVPMRVLYNKEGREVVLAQTGTQFANVGKLLITADGKVSTSLIPVAELSHRNVRVKALADSVKALVQHTLDSVVCHSEVDLRIRDDEGRVIARVCETNACDLLADAMRVTTGAQIGVFNAGSIRNDLKAGTVTYGDVVAHLPYDNWLCVVRVSGRQIIDMLTANIVSLPNADGQFPQVSGMKYTIDATAHTVSDVVVLDAASGQYLPIDPEQTYTLTTTDYAIYNGGMRNTLRGAEVVQKNVILYRDALVQYVTENLSGRVGHEYAKPQGRIRIVNVEWGMLR